MEENGIKRVRDTNYGIFFGLFLVLLSSVLAINVGVVAKGMSIAFVYLFGMSAYLFYAFMFTEGIFLIFTSRPIRVKFHINIIWAVLILILLSSLLTYFSVNQDSGYLSLNPNNSGSVYFLDKLNNFVENCSYTDGSVDSYFRPGLINIFFTENEVGSGFVGCFLLALFNSILGSKFSGFLFTLIFIGFFVLMIFLPIIIKAIIRLAKKRRANRPAKKVKENKKKDKIFKDKSKTIAKPAPKIKNIDVVKNARKIDPNNYHSEVSGIGSNRGTSDELIDGDISNIRTSILETPVFKPTDDDYNIPNISNSFKREEIIEEKYDEPALDNQQEMDDISNNFNNENIFNEESNFVNEEQPTFTHNEDNNLYEEPVRNEEVKIKPRPVIKEVFTPLSSDMLNVYETDDAAAQNSEAAEERKEAINQFFKDFNIGAQVVDYTIGSSITRFNVRYAPNVSSRSVSNLVQDISIRLHGVSARFESVVEGQATSGLEIPNPVITTVSFKEVYDALPDVKKHPLAIGFGKNIQGDVISADYDEFPHMLIAGTTGSGKSVMVNEIICTLIMRNSPNSLKLVLVDPKKVEMSVYADMPHLLTPVITEPSKVKICLDKLCQEMEERYSLFSRNHATNIREYNEDCDENGNEKIPYIVAILDEYANLIESCKEISIPVVSLAQKARACGIHIMLATQRPSSEVVTGIIKANIPTHVALKTAGSMDSVVILGEGGAEKLLGKGDMLVQSPLISTFGVTRLQGCYIDRKEIRRIVETLKAKYPTNYDEKFIHLEEPPKNNNFMGPQMPRNGADEEEESKYQTIKEWVMSQEYMSISRIQREMGVGFNRAGRFFIRLQEEGIISEGSEGNRGSKVLLQDKFGDIDDSVVTSEENSYLKK